MSHTPIININGNIGKSVSAYTATSNDIILTNQSTTARLNGIESSTSNLQTQVGSLWNSKVPYSGASANVNLTTFGLTASSISSGNGITGTTISAITLLAGNFQTSTANLQNSITTLNTIQGNYAVLSSSNIFTNSNSISANTITAGTLSAIVLLAGNFQSSTANLQNSINILNTIQSNYAVLSASNTFTNANSISASSISSSSMNVANTLTASLGWFTTKSGSAEEVLRLGRLSDSTNTPLYSIYTDDDTGDFLRIKSNRYNNNVNFESESPNGTVSGALLTVLGSSSSTTFDLYDATKTVGTKISSSGNPSYFLRTNVGIGTTFPIADLHVTGSILSNTFVANNIIGTIIGGTTIGAITVTAVTISAITSLASNSISANTVTAGTLSAITLLAGNFQTSTASLQSSINTLNTIQGNYAVLSGNNVFTNINSISANSITAGTLSGIVLLAGNFQTITASHNNRLTGLESGTGNLQTQIGSLWNSKIPYNGATANLNISSFSISGTNVSANTISATVLLAGNFQSSTASLNTAATGERNTISNLIVSGSQTGNIFAQKIGDGFQFKAIVAGSNLGLTEFSDRLVISGQSSAGEINTASNTGTGTGWFRQKVGTNLEFRTLSAGTALLLTTGDLVNTISFNPSSSLTVNSLSSDNGITGSTISAVTLLAGNFQTSTASLQSSINNLNTIQSNYAILSGSNVFTNSNIFTNVNSISANSITAGTLSSRYISITSDVSGIRLDIIGQGGSNILFRVNGRLQSNTLDGGLWIENNGFIGGDTSNRIGFYNNGAWRLQVASGGNIGIGTNNPLASIHTTGSISATSLTAINSISVGLPSATGTISLSGLQSTTGQYHSYFINNLTATTAFTLNWSYGNVQRIVLTGAVTFSISGGQPGGRYLLQLDQGSTTGAATWPAIIKWVNATIPTLSTTANKTDILSFIYNGTNYYGIASTNFA